jgi:ketosteroid isomerase-like protein
MLYRRASLSTLTVCLVLACAPADEAVEDVVASLEADLAAIAEAGQQLVASIDTDDVDGIMAGLTPDHVTMAPNVPALAGEELRAWHESRVAAGTTTFTRTSEEVTVLGDWVWERWSSRISYTPREGGEAEEGVGKGVWIWQRQPDGEWMLARSIWNSDLPRPTGG